MNKKTIAISIILVWVILLSSVIVYKEYTLQTGETILLKTQPIDPRDMFRGDYVILNYEISNLDTDMFQNVEIEEGNTVYVQLQKEGDYWTAANVHEQNPSTLSLRGKIMRIRPGGIEVKYGIESFFVPEGEGKELERYRNAGNLDVEISVDSFGNGIINNLYIDEEVWIAP